MPLPPPPHVCVAAAHFTCLPHTPLSPHTHSHVAAAHYTRLPHTPSPHASLSPHPLTRGSRPLHMHGACPFPSNWAPGVRLELLHLTCCSSVVAPQLLHVIPPSST
eukprot:202251-Chlamydomonas_euryale.AAC.3